jgi:uncharacterized sporulation protein YeaH/YhbH (DUF444 family)
VSEKMFYDLRYGGGTTCTTSVQLMTKLIKTRFNPTKWNIYAFYFGDGETSIEDNRSFVKILRNELGANVVNLFGIVEVLHYEGFGDSMKKYVDEQIGKGGLTHVKSVSVDRQADSPWHLNFSDESKRDEEVKKVIKALLGKEQKVESY